MLMKGGVDRLVEHLKSDMAFKWKHLENMPTCYARACKSGFGLVKLMLVW